MAAKCLVTDVDRTSLSSASGGVGYGPSSPWERHDDGGDLPRGSHCYDTVTLDGYPQRAANTLGASSPVTSNGRRVHRDEYKIKRFAAVGGNEPAVVQFEIDTVPLALFKASQVKEMDAALRCASSIAARVKKAFAATGSLETRRSSSRFCLRRSGSFSSRRFLF